MRSPRSPSRASSGSCCSRWGSALPGRCVWLVGGDRASVSVGEGGVLAAAAGLDVVVVEQFVVSLAEQDQVGEHGLAAVGVGDEVVGFELARGAAAGVLTML